MRFSTIESPVPRIAAIRFYHYPSTRRYLGARVVAVGGYVYSVLDPKKYNVFTGRFYKHGHYTLDRGHSDVLEALRQLRLVNKAEIAVHERAVKFAGGERALRSIKSDMRSYGRQYGIAALRRECSTVICDLSAENKRLKAERKHNVSNQA